MVVVKHLSLRDGSLSFPLNSVPYNLVSTLLYKLGRGVLLELPKLSIHETRQICRFCARDVVICDYNERE